MTALATLVAATTVGQYAQLTGVGNIAALQDNGASGNELGYVSRMPFDPITNRCYLNSSDHLGTGRRQVAYDIATNAWVTLIPSSAPGTVAHGYGNQCMDIAMRRLWYGTGGTSSEPYSYRNLDTGAITTSAGPSGLAFQAAPSMCEFPERHSVYLFCTTQVRRKREDAAWTTLSGSFPTNTHSIAHYNARHQCVVFGGGDSPTGGNLWRINRDETIEQYSGLPSTFSQPRYRWVENDATGEFFIYYGNAGDTNFWKFNPSILTSGAWTNPGTSGIPSAFFAWPLGGDNRLSLTAENIFTHGCMLFATCAPSGTPTMWIYRYR